MYKEISKCRVCSNTKLKTVINLGAQKLTGVFPLPGEFVDDGPLELVKCEGESGCGLVQLRHSCDTSQMYGLNYGYRSGLNQSMVEHLSNITSYIKRMVTFDTGDIVLDIGSNDGTLLGTYCFDENKNIHLCGMDPTAVKFKQYYKSGIEVIEDFFSANNFVSRFGTEKKAKVITSIAMFYDLEDPIAFAKQVEQCLDENGIWVFEQSYMPFMIQARSFDTICQEHLEYYSMKQIQWILDEAELKIIDVDFNNVNGGSFRITAAKKNSTYEKSNKVDQALISEAINGYNSFEIFEEFRSSIDDCKNECLEFLNKCKNDNKRVIGYGASTKGNVLLQYFGITPDLLPFIAEVNQDKFGHTTPGTEIPIISETEARSMKPDYFFVLPWHFKNNILDKERAYMAESGCKFVFPLPKFSIY